jgi:ArsR family transcriptional regulator
MSIYSDIVDLIMDNQIIKTHIIDQTVADQLAELFKVFSDSSRIRIISALVLEELNVGEIAEQVGISESAVSHHMRTLRQIRLVRARRDGRQIYYSLEDEHVATLFKMGLDHILHG